MRDRLLQLTKQKRVFSSLLAVLFILFFTLYVVLFINTQSRDERSRASSAPSSKYIVTAASIKGTTETLRQQLQGWSSLQAKSRDEAKLLLKARQTYLKELIIKDPKAFMQQATLSLEFSKLDKATQQELSPFIESQTTVSGTYHKMIVENENAAYEFGVLTTPDQKKSYRLTQIDQKPLPANIRITAQGIVLDSDIVVSTSNGGSVKSAPVQAANNGSQLKTAVILINFRYSGPTPVPNFTVDDVKQRVYTAPDSLRNFVEKTSYYVPGVRGATLSGDPNTDVYGWVTVDYDPPGSANECEWADLLAWGSNADSKINYRSSYAHKIYIWPRNTNCTLPLVEGPFNGMAEINGSKSFINGAVTTRTLSHELGHNFGLQHAIGITCPKPTPSKAIDYYDKCRLPKDGQTGVSNYEYGDRYDTMGSGGKFTPNGDFAINTAPHFNAKYKMQIGWLSSSRMQTVTSSSSMPAYVTLLPIETYTDTGYQVVRIPKPIGTASQNFPEDYYYVEYRTPTNIDNIWPINTLNTGGVAIRIFGNNKYLITGAGGSSPSTALVDAITPFNADFTDAVLKNPGNISTDTFTDSINNISIRLVSVTSTQAVICIAIGTSTCNTISPTPTRTPTPSPTRTPTPTPTRTPTPTLKPIALTLVSTADKPAYSSRVTSAEFSATFKNSSTTTAQQVVIKHYMPYSVSNPYGITLGGCTTTLGTAQLVVGSYCEYVIPNLLSQQSVTVKWTGQILNGDSYVPPTMLPPSITIRYKLDVGPYNLQGAPVSNVSYQIWDRSFVLLRPTPTPIPTN